MMTFLQNTKELWYDWMGANQVLFLGINSFRGAQYDRFMQAVSWLGRHENFPLYLSIIAAYAFLVIAYKFLRRQPGRWNYSATWLGALLVLCIGHGANSLMVDTLKNHFAYPRPYVALAGKEKVYKLEATTERDDYRSLPSGHIAFTTLMIMALTPVLGGMYATAGGALILLMAWSRISLGMHFPADTLYGFLLTALLIGILRWLLYSMLRHFGIKC